jgi:hypothetical protein
MDWAWVRETVKRASKPRMKTIFFINICVWSFTLLKTMPNRV